MTDGPVLVVQYCDDVRREVGNKLSLVGCYGDDLITDRFPLLLPKIAVHIRLFSATGQPLARMALRAFLNDDLLGQLEAQEQVPATSASSAVLVFAPLAVERPSVLRIEASLGTAVLHGNVLNIREGKAIGH